MEIEKIGVFRAVDAEGNEYTLYPITKTEAVDDFYEAVINTSGKKNIEIRRIPDAIREEDGVGLARVIVEINVPDGMTVKEFGFLYISSPTVRVDVCLEKLTLENVGLEFNGGTVKKIQATDLTKKALGQNITEREVGFSIRGYMKLLTEDQKEIVVYYDSIVGNYGDGFGGVPNDIIPNNLLYIVSFDSSTGTLTTKSSDYTG